MRVLFFMLSLVLVWMVSSLPLYSQVNADKVKRSGLVQQGHVQAEIDSLKSLLLNTLNGNDKIEIYGQLCFTYASTIGDVPVAHQYADSIQYLAEHLKNKAGLASA